MQRGDEGGIAYAEREDDAKMAALIEVIEEGEASGIAEGDVFARVRRRMRMGARGV